MTKYLTDGAGMVVHLLILKCSMFLLSKSKVADGLRVDPKTREKLPFLNFGQTLFQTNTNQSSLEILFQVAMRCWKRSNALTTMTQRFVYSFR